MPIARSITAALLIAAASLSSHAQEARVIVKFKDGASMLREHALSASSSASHAVTLEARAGTLGARRGLALRGGVGIGERSQVMHADGMSAQALAARLAADPDVEYAEPDRRVYRTAVPNDTLFFNGGASGPAVGQWYLRAPAGEVVSSIDAVRAWDFAKGAGVIVAVLDTGITAHPDLAGKLLPGYDMVSDAAIANDGGGRDSDPSDPGDWITSADRLNPVFSGCDLSSSSWHGTQTAGIVGAATDNGSGMAGAGWNVKVLPVRVLGKCSGFISDIVAGMRWAAGLAVPGVPANPNPAKVLNLSLGSADPCSQSEADAVAAVRAAGAVVVAAAGNTAGLAAGSPASCAGVIGVAAVRHVGTKVGFSDVGASLSIAAPGGNCVNVGAGQPCLYPILATINSGTTTPGASTYSDGVNPSVGTSFSSPLVAAAAALMLAAQPGLTPDGVRAALQSSARPFPSSGVADDPGSGPIQACHAPNGVSQLQCYCTTTTCGAGMLDAGAAVAAVAGLKAAIGVAPAAPQAGQPITFDSAGSTAAAGRSIASRLWTLVDGGGAASSFIGAVDGTTATLTPGAAGTLVVRLTITDSGGTAVSTDQSVAVSAAPAPVTPVTPVTPAAAAGSGGGGAVSGAWLLALACGALALRRRPHNPAP